MPSLKFELNAAMRLRAATMDDVNRLEQMFTRHFGKCIKREEQEGGAIQIEWEKGDEGAEVRCSGNKLSVKVCVGDHVFSCIGVDSCEEVCEHLKSDVDALIPKLDAAAAAGSMKARRCCEALKKFCKCIESAGM